MTELSSSDWDKFLSGHPEAHLLQTTAWGELKAAFGWRVLRVAAEGGAQVLLRRLPLGFSLAYIPAARWETIGRRYGRLSPPPAASAAPSSSKWSPIYGNPPPQRVPHPQPA